MEVLRKGMKIAGIAASGARDVQGETLSIDGADINELLAGRGRLNDNHQASFVNCLGKVTFAKKIYKAEDCQNDREKYYWNKLQSPIIYFEGELFDSEDHPNAKAVAAILRHLNKSNNPLKIGASVEGGVISRNVRDHSHLERTKIHSIALTFTPANRATLVEPVSVNKSDTEAVDLQLIKSVAHLAKTDVPSFKYVVRDSRANRIIDNLNAISALMGGSAVTAASGELVRKAMESKIAQNVVRIKELVQKAMTAGYGGAGSPTALTGGGVFQSESVDGAREAKPIGVRIMCPHCGTDQAYLPFQSKCRGPGCGRPFPMTVLYPAMKKLKS